MMDGSFDAHVTMQLHITESLHLRSTQILHSQIDKTCILHKQNLPSVSIICSHYNLTKPECLLSVGVYMFLQQLGM